VWFYNSCYDSCNRKRSWFMFGHELVVLRDIDQDYDSCYDLCDRVTACSREDETRNGQRNTKRNPRRSSQGSFHTAHLKRDLNFHHRGFRFVIRWPFRVSSSRKRAVWLAFFSLVLWFVLWFVAWRLYTYKTMYIYVYICKYVHV